MAQPAQVKFTLPDNSWVAIDNSAASPTTTLNTDKALLGFDTPAVAAPFLTGAVAQGLNSFGDTGTVLLDSVNDIPVVDFSDSTVKGNPVLNTGFPKTVLTTVLNDNRQGIRILFKNPA